MLQSLLCTSYVTPKFSHVFLLSFRNSLIAQLVKHLPAMQETPVQSLGQEDPLEKEMATHSSIIAWRIPWTEAPDSPWVARVGHHWVTKHAHQCPWASFVAQLEKNLPAWGRPGLGRSLEEGNPLQYFGLENSRDCIVHGVAKSWTHDWTTFTLCKT